jgi:hypothetical protein
VWRAQIEKDLAMATGRPSFLEIAHQRLAGILGRGRARSRRVLPARIKMLPARQSTSSNWSRTTSPARRPSRANSRSMARSRSPCGVGSAGRARTRFSSSVVRKRGKAACFHWRTRGIAYCR